MTAQAVLAKKFRALRFRVALQKCECSRRWNSSRGVRELHDALGFNLRIRNSRQITLRLGRLAVVIIIKSQAGQHACTDKQGESPNDIEPVAKFPAPHERHYEQR